jgi:hypothetical protein
MHVESGKFLNNLEIWQLNNPKRNTCLVPVGKRNSLGNKTLQAICPGFLFLIRVIENLSKKFQGNFHASVDFTLKK